MEAVVETRIPVPPPTTYVRILLTAAEAKVLREYLGKAKYFDDCMIPYHEMLLNLILP